MYGIGGPRRRSSPVAGDAGSFVVLAGSAETAIADVPAERPTVPDLWRDESRERAEVRGASRELVDPEERFDTLRIELEAAFDRRIRVAVDQMRITFDGEIEALRTLNREEAKRNRSSNDEAFVRIRVSNTQELHRIRAAIDEGIARLCSVLEGQLDRVWAADDVELERIRSAGADRLAEVQDLLSHQLDQLRSAQAAAAPKVKWGWLRRRSVPAPH